MINEHICSNGYKILTHISIFEAKNGTGSWYLELMDGETCRMVSCVKIFFCPYCGERLIPKKRKT